MPRPLDGLRANRILIGLVVVHVVWGAARIPSRVFERRLRHIAAHEARGDVRYHLDNEHRQGAAAVERLRATSPPDSVVLWRGKWRGSFEFAVALLAPRLLVHTDRVPIGASEFLGRPLARLDAGAGVAVLVGDGDDLRLELR